MPSKKLNTPWTPADVRAMRRMAKAGESARFTAQVLGRSRGAVAFKAMTLGIRFHAIKQPIGLQKRLARLRMKTGRMDVTLDSRAAA